MARCISVAYQGEPGSNSEAAVHALNKKMSASQVLQPVPHHTFAEAFIAVSSAQCDAAMIPFENSIGGSVHDNYDLLAEHNLEIYAEIHYKVVHCAMALKGTRIEDVTRVISHPQAIAQCGKYISTLPNSQVRAEIVYDTAGAAKMVQKECLVNTIALASELAANMYNLEILQKGVEDDHTNTTRFLFLMRRHSFAPLLPVANIYKTSIVFTLENRPGALNRALQVLALRDLDLTRIESRPTKRVSWISEQVPNRETFSYVFFADILGHIDQPNMEKALSQLAELFPIMRILGSYPSLHASTDAPCGIHELPLPSNSLKIAIIGFGNFGQFLAKTFVKQGHRVTAWSRSNYEKVGTELDVQIFSSPEALFNDLPNVVLLSVSILSFQSIVSILPWTSLPHSTLVVDVLSVKSHPREVLLASLPANLGILCTHPMFGPESGKFNWQGLPFVYERVRMTSHDHCFLNIFERGGCRMVEMTCEQHDQYAAGSQFLTHTIGRLLLALDVRSTPIDTKGYSTLLNVVNNTVKDSFDLYRGLFVFNPFSKDQLQALESALIILRRSLLDTDADIRRINQRVARMNESKTAAVTDLATDLRRQGHKIISVSVGEPVDSVPDFIAQAVVDAQMKGRTKYTPVVGTYELRQAICNKLQLENSICYTPEQIVVSNGAKQCIAQAILALVEPGDEVIIPAPYWVSYPDIVTLAGGTPFFINTTADDNWLINPSQLRKVIRNNTRAIIICSPNNPTGSVYSYSQLEQVINVLREYPHVLVISDEIYEHLVFDGHQHTSIAAFDGMYERTITINGLSKAFAMTGYRIGYLAAPLWIVSAVAKVQSQLTSCASSVSQAAALAAYSNFKAGKAFIESMVQQMDRNRHVVLNSIKLLAGRATSTIPQGAFYIMLDVSALYGSKYLGIDGIETTIRNSEDMSIYLLQHGVALVPGSAFGNDNTLRISFSADPELLQQAMDIIVHGLQLLHIRPD